jgi:hypothetical protein
VARRVLGRKPLHGRGAGSFFVARGADPAEMFTRSRAEGLNGWSPPTPIGAVW